AARRLLDDLGYGGFGITEEKVRVDFETTTDVTDEVLVELERLANRAVWESKSVTWEHVEKDAALDRDEVAFNAATEEGVMADAETIRIVTIDGWDVAACGGTHVENTRDIGQITTLERSNPGEGLTRVEFAVGPRAHERRALEHEAVRDVARAIGTNVEEMSAEVDRLLEERASLEDEVRSLTATLADTTLRNLREVEREGKRWRVGVIQDLDADVLGETMQELAGKVGDVVLVASGDDRATVQVATDGTLDADDVVDDLTDTFGGGGGGSPTYAQGGGLDARPEDVLDAVL
ncbi:MAG: DHHA1 domain-containing protein, partial [Halanaeroarchaeum sp.]